MKKNISIIIPVYQEPEINATLAELSLQNHPSAEILVIDGDEKGETISLIQDTSIRKYVSPKGRASQMNYGAEKASGDILLFLHADSRLPDKGLFKIRKIINSGYKAGCFDIHFDSSNFLLREILSRTSSLRGRITRLPYGDQAFFFTRQYFQEIGGFPDIPIMEDIALMQKIKKRNGKIFIIPAKVTTSDRRWRQEGLVYVMVRNPILASLYYLGVEPQKLSKYYR